MYLLFHKIHPIQESWLTQGQRLLNALGVFENLLFNGMSIDID